MNTCVFLSCNPTFHSCIQDLLWCGLNRPLQLYLPGFLCIHNSFINRGFIFHMPSCLHATLSVTKVFHFLFACWDDNFQVVWEFDPSFRRGNAMSDGEMREGKCALLGVRSENCAEFHRLSFWTRPRTETQRHHWAMISTWQVSTSSLWVCFWMCRRGIRTPLYKALVRVMSVLEPVAEHRTDTIYDPWLSFPAPFLSSFPSENANKYD